MNDPGLVFINRIIAIGFGVYAFNWLIDKLSEAKGKYLWCKQGAYFVVISCVVLMTSIVIHNLLINAIGPFNNSGSGHE